MNFSFTQPVFWISLVLGGALLFAIGWRQKLRWWPAWPLRVLFFGLVLVGITLPQTRRTGGMPPERTVLIIDQSDSITPEDRTLARANARQWLGAGENRLVILAGLESYSVYGAEWPRMDGSATDLAGALDLAADALGEADGRIIIATDGLSSDPLALEQVLRKMTSSDNPPVIDIIPLENLVFPTDISLGAPFLPSAMWENSPFTVVLPILAGQAGEVALQVYQNETLILEETLDLSVGRNLRTYEFQTSAEEILTLGFVVESPIDPRLENNEVYASLRVYPAPHALIVTEDVSTSLSISNALGVAGLDTDLMTPNELPVSLSELETYQVILLHNFLATSLSEAQMRTLRDFVQQLGRGLIFLGGRNAYTLGGYKNTLLEPVLPVRLEPPPRVQESPLTFVMAFDRSASMAPQGTPNNLRPITLAREAALRAVENLGPEDYLGILTYNTNIAWTIPLGIVGEGLALQRTKDAISQVNASGGTSIFKAMNAAVTGILDATTSETRHLLLLSDGQSTDGTLQEFVALAQFANESGITISTIALGVEADQELMALIAEAGKGRYYAVLEPADLPNILVAESRAARGENVQEGTTRPIQGEPGHPILSGFSTSAMPNLFGYNALESKALFGAEDVLISSGFEDPLLSVWQYGLGRVVAWTSDIGEEWGSSWVEWDDLGRFWSQVIRYALPDPALGPGQVEVDLNPAELTVTGQIITASGIPRNGLEVKFSFVDTEGTVRSYPVPQTGPGLYTLSLPRPEDGVYRGVLQYPDEDGIPVEVAAPVEVNYPLEWLPVQRSPVEGLTKLNSWSNQSGGASISWESLIPTGSPSGDAVLNPNQVLQRLILAMLLLWPLEIAIRRRWMPWR